MTQLTQYTVTWRDDGDDYMVTTVEISEDINPHSLSTNEWADLASAVEHGNTVVTDDEEHSYLPSRDGYDLITVVAGVPDFIY